MYATTEKDRQLESISITLLCSLYKIGTNNRQHIYPQLTRLSIV